MIDPDDPGTEDIESRDPELLEKIAADVTDCNPYNFAGLIYGKRFAIAGALRARARAIRAESPDKGDGQAAELERVSGAIGDLVREFWQSKLESQCHDFHADDLRDFVIERTHRAPASPDRILRNQRKRGVVNYVVTNRAQSLYRALPLDAARAP